MSGMSGMVLEALADASLRAALVAVFVAALLAALRVRPAGTRHAAWAFVLVAMLLMPALSRLVPAVGVPVPPAPRDVVAAAVAATPGPRTERNPAATAPPPLTPPRREPGVPRVVDFLEAMAERNLADPNRLRAAATDVRGGRPPSRLFERAAPPR